MKKIPWQDGLQEMIAKLCAVFPAVIKTRWESRLRYSAEKIAAYEEAPAVNDDIFWRAVYEVFPGGYEPLILSCKDPGRMRAEVAASKAQEDIAPGDEPLVITRWAKDGAAAPQPGPAKKILAVNSSMRKGGNTDVLIDEALRSCSDSGCTVEKLYLGDLAIKPCTGCRACRKGDVKTICAVKDDMTEQAVRQALRYGRPGAGVSHLHGARKRHHGQFHGPVGLPGKPRAVAQDAPGEKGAGHLDLDVAQPDGLRQRGGADGDTLAAACRRDGRGADPVGYAGQAARPRGGEKSSRRACCRLSGRRRVCRQAALGRDSGCRQYRDMRAYNRQER